MDCVLRKPEAYKGWKIRYADFISPFDFDSLIVTVIERRNGDYVEQYVLDTDSFSEAKAFIDMLEEENGRD